jgi:hypothetical protein
MKPETLFVSLIFSRESWAQIKILETSLQWFGGEMSSSSVLLFDPLGGSFPVEFKTKENIEIQPLVLSKKIGGYLFAEKVTAMAKAEKLARNDYKTITWIDPMCLILKPPILYRLDEKVDAAFRPVHIQNVGLRADDPLDEYWRRIYRACGVNDIDRTVESFVDGQHLRAYFNTHAFSINPAIGLMGKWLEIFTKLVLDREFQATCCKDDRHRIFLFQAILSTLLVRELESERIRILPPLYNYPYNLQSSIPAEKRISSIGNLVSLTYEGRSINPVEITDINISQPYLEFLQKFS